MSASDSSEETLMVLSQEVVKLVPVNATVEVSVDVVEDPSDLFVSHISAVVDNEVVPKLGEANAAIAVSVDKLELGIDHVREAVPS